MSEPWLRCQADGSMVLTLHVQPGAKTTQGAGLHGEALKLRLAAPPVDGKANACLIGFLSDYLAIPKASLELVSGLTSRQKRVRISDPSPQTLARLQALAQA